MDYINEVGFRQSTLEDPGFSYTYALLPLTGNSVITARRCVYGVDASWVDVSSLASITANKVTLANIWTTGETKTAGRYRVQIICGNGATNGIPREEMNAIIDVPY